MRDSLTGAHGGRTAERRLVVPVRGAPGAHLFVRAGGQGPREHVPALVVCPGFIQNRRAFELPARSLLDHLVGAGFDVYALEFAKHERHRHEGLAHYVDRVAPVALDIVRRRHSQVAWVGHSMGGLVGAALPTHETSRLSALVTLGSPLRPGIGVKLTRALEGAIASASRGLVRRGAAFRGAQLAAMFRLGAGALDHPRARFPLQIWAPGHLRREELLWSLSNAFVEDSWGALADMLDLTHTDGERAGWVLMGERLRALSCPLLVIGADRDGLAPLSSTRALYARAGSAQKRLLEVGAATHGVPFGHIDMLIGEHAPASVWQPLTAFLHAAVRGELPADREVPPV